MAKVKAAPSHEQIGEEQTTAEIIPHEKSAVVTIGGRSFTVTKRVTSRAISFTDGVPMFLRFTGPFYRAEPLPEQYNPKGLAPPIMADVVDLETGECLKLMCNTVLISELLSQYCYAYDDNERDMDVRLSQGLTSDHLNRSFAITRYPAAKEDKLYKLFDIVEIAQQ